MQCAHAVVSRAAYRHREVRGRRRRATLSRQCDAGRTHRGLGAHVGTRSLRRPDEVAALTGEVGGLEDRVGRGQARQVGGGVRAAAAASGADVVVIEEGAYGGLVGGRVGGHRELAVVAPLAALALVEGDGALETGDLSLGRVARCRHHPRLAVVLRVGIGGVCPAVAADGDGHETSLVGDRQRRLDVADRQDLAPARGSHLVTIVDREHVGVSVQVGWGEDAGTVVACVGEWRRGQWQRLGVGAGHGSEHGVRGGQQHHAPLGAVVGPKKTRSFHKGVNSGRLTGAKTQDD
eukprot:scaffold19775_cov33-Phaeocystis_antarctica.AAC.2